MSRLSSTSTRGTVLGALLSVLLILVLRDVAIPRAAAQAKDPGAATVAAPAAPAPAPMPGQRTAWQTLKAGGTIGAIIILLSVVSMTFVVDHFLTIRKERLMPARAAEELDAMIARKEIDDAIAFCEEPANHSLLTDVVLAGLLRYKNSDFGFAEYRAAVEEEGEEQTAKLYRRTEVLSVIGAIAPMLGLLGTVQGMIEAFNTIAATGGMAKPADLADAISKALVTTLEGLTVAIPTLTALSYFRTRIDSLVAEAGKRVEQIMLPLGRPK
jgi:biopolymer transport protein ExbB